MRGELEQIMQRIRKHIVANETSTRLSSEENFNYELDESEELILQYCEPKVIRGTGDLDK